MTLLDRIKSYLGPQKPLTDAEKLAKLKTTADAAEAKAKYYEDALKERQRLAKASERIQTAKKGLGQSTGGLLTPRNLTIGVGVVVILFFLLKGC